MYNRFRLYTPVICALMGLSAVLALIMPFFNRTLFYIGVSITLLTFAAVLVMLRGANRKTRKMLKEIAMGIEAANSGGFMDFPMPVVVVYDGSEIIWYNEPCAAQVWNGADMRGEDVSEVLSGLDVSRQSPPQGHCISYGEQKFTAYVSRCARTGERISVIYLINDTELKYYENEYHQTRPSVAIIVVDSYDEMVQDLKEGDRAQIMSGIEDEIEKYITSNHGFIIRFGRERFAAVIEERGIQNMLQNRFDLLDRVRNKYNVERVNATLSIGVGRGAGSLAEAENMARQALDMCLGRGGDQAAVKLPGGYEFYGGVSKGVEKRTKVKTRIISSALGEAIESSSNVIIMGHRFADLDCLGSAAGLLKAVKSLDIPCVICIDMVKNLVRPLIDRMLTAGYTQDDFASPQNALRLVGDRTLLIVVDTHVPAMLESEELYHACKNVVVIDHHRKLVQYIDNSLIFYHEPFASSASEMVAELVQYFPSSPQMTRMEAEAMLAGIMLDTKNFVLRTGVRTFEAAAYLRRLGADTVEVRKLFASTMESYQQKANLVSNAEIYEKCAIAASDYQFEAIKVVAPQAADELMNISGVEASFVIFCYDGGVNISARSLGAVNVQLIMEKLGGGGHHTMAAAQFKGENFENVRKLLIEAIDEYHASLVQTVQ